MQLSIIIPVLNEAGLLRECLERLQALRRLGHQLIVVDGGSEDDSLALAGDLSDLQLQSPRGRASQMNCGAAAAEGEVLLFLHVDVILAETAATLIAACMLDSASLWGRFDVRLSGSQFPLRVVERAMNLRSRLTGVATGDQAIFVRRSVFRDIGGFAEIPLMEDVEFSKRLRRRAWPQCLRETVTVSSRRWEQQGIVRTILLMWWLRWLFFIGVAPARLLKMYYKKP